MRVASLRDLLQFALSSKAEADSEYSASFWLRIRHSTDLNSRAATAGWHFRIDSSSSTTLGWHAVRYSEGRASAPLPRTDSCRPDPTNLRWPQVPCPFPKGC